MMLENAVTVEVLATKGGATLLRFTLSGGKTWERWLVPRDKQIISLSVLESRDIPKVADVSAHNPDTKTVCACDHCSTLVGRSHRIHVA